MRSTGKRVLSALLTIAMIATLLVVPAAAAKTAAGNVTTYTLEVGANKEITETVGTRVNMVGDYFSVLTNTVESKSITPVGGGSKGNQLGAKIAQQKTDTGDSHKKVNFTTKYDNAEVTVWWFTVSDSRCIAAVDSNAQTLLTAGNMLGGTSVPTTSGVSKSTGYETKFKIPTKGTKCWIGGNGGDIYFYKLEVKETEPIPEGGSMRPTFAGEDGHVFSMAEGLKEVNSINFTLSYTPDASTTFTLYAAGETADTYTAVKTGVAASGTTLTFSELNPAIKAGTYYVSATESGKDESAKTEVVVQEQQNPAKDITMLVTDINLAAAGTQDLSIEVVAEDPSKACTDALEVKVANENVAAWADGKVTGKAIGATTITATAGAVTKSVKVFVKGASQTGPVYTFSADKMGAGALIDGVVKYDDYFTINTKSSKVENNPQEIAGASLTNRLNPSTNGNITFTTTADKSTVDVWFVQNGERDFKLDSTTASSKLASKPAANTAAKVTFEDVAKGAHTIAMVGGTMYIYQIVVDETVAAAPTTTAPEFATNGNTYQMPSKAATKVTFTLKDAPANGNTVYRLYNAQTEGQQLGENAGVKADANKQITFTLTSAPTAEGGDQSWYVSAQAPDEVASDRTAVTVKPYIPVTKVRLTHFTTSTPGTGETHEPDHVGAVGHELYEKMPGAQDVIGSAENHTVKYPNGWVLKAVVEPSNATNQEVKFSNARTTPEFIEVSEDGTVKAIKAGTGRVRVSSVGDPDVTAAFDMTVKVRVASVEIQKVDGTAAPTSLAMGETLELKAVVTASASASQSHDVVNWTSSDESVATVKDGVVTPKKADNVTITATNNVDKDVKDTLELTITKGTPVLKLTTGNPQVTSSGTVRFKLEGVPAGVTPTFTVKEGTTEVNTVTVEALENDPDGYNYKAVMPENDTGATVTYTVTAAVGANDNWNAAEKSVSVGVLDKNAKNIFIVSPGTTQAVELTKGESAKLEVVAQVNGAGQVKDEAATAALTYAWTKDGTATSDTTYAITVDAAGEYVCTVTSADAAVVTKTVSVTFTVTEVAPALTTINVTAASGVDYTAATGALKITGPVDATFTVTTGPDGHEDTVAATSDKPSVARVTLVDGKLTITPWSVGTATITLKGTKATDVVKTINVTVVKAAAPAALTANDYTVTQPTTVGGKGTITITQNAPAGTEYVYRLGDSGDWVKFPANKTIEVEPGTYKIRVYVPKPELQETTNGVPVEIKAFTAAPTVERVTVSSTTSSVKVGASVQMEAQVHMSNNTVSATEKVTWGTSDASVATVSATGLVTGVKAGVVTITATSVTDSTKKGSKTVTVTAKDEGVDKSALSAAIDAAEAVYAIDADVEVLPTGTKAGTVDKGTKFVTEKDMADLKAAIDAAKVVLADAKATKADVDKAVADLNAAKAAFKVQTGTKGSKRPSSSRDERNPGGTTPATGLPFVDVKAEDWFFNNVQKAYEKGLMKGVDAERFAPNSNTTRAMVATVLFRLDGEKKADVENLFNDVATDSWFADAVTWAAEKGVVKGYDETTFAPNDNVTREQLVVMLYRYAAVSAKSEEDLSAFTDAASISDWAVDAMTWAVEKGIILGRGNGKLDPQGLASRAEICAVLVRFLDVK